MSTSRSFWKGSLRWSKDVGQQTIDESLVGLLTTAISFRFLLGSFGASTSGAKVALRAVCWCAQPPAPYLLQEFSQGAEQITTKRTLNKQMLNCHSTLLDLLEVPQLMDTCVRNGNYDEALDLEAFAAKLAVLHSNIPVVVSLKAEVKAISQSMLQQLLHRLQSSIHLPECLRLIGYLRRMAVSEPHIKDTTNDC
eukprot:543828-Prorocentrum_minimum.AAC.1